MKKLIALAVLSLAPAAVHAFELNGVALGGREADVRRAMPSANCKPLEWKSQAADRRCDDAKVMIGGVAVKATLFLKADSIRAFDLRFDINNREKLLAHFKTRWGPPQSEAMEAIAKRSGGDRKIQKVRWAKGGDQAVFTAQLDRRRATLSAWRGDFSEEIYRVR